MLNRVFRWIFGDFSSPGKIDELYFSFNLENGQKEWFRHSEYDCAICGGPGFECDDTHNCKFYPKIDF